MKRRKTGWSFPHRTDSDRDHVDVEINVEDTSNVGLTMTVKKFELNSLTIIPVTFLEL